MWARQTWEEVRGEDTLFPSTVFFPEALQKRLREKIHVVTSIKQLRGLLHDWHYLDSHGDRLTKFCQEMLEGLEDFRQEAQDMIVEDDGQEIQAESSVKIKIPALKEKAHKVDPVGERPQKRLCRE